MARAHTNRMNKVPPTKFPQSHSTWLLVLTCVLTHLPMLPAAVFVYRRNLLFETFFAVCIFISSIMYHLCEALRRPIFMSDLRWHKLDNVFAIGIVCGTCVHLAVLDDRARRTKILYVILYIIMVLQEADPWNEMFTFYPIAGAVCFPVVSHLLYREKRRRVQWRRVFTGLGLLVVAGLFFVRGLDDRNDPARIFHGMFHVFVGLAMYFLWLSLSGWGEYRLEAVGKEATATTAAAAAHGGAGVMGGHSGGVTRAEAEAVKVSKKFDEAPPESTAVVHFGGFV